MWWARSDFWLCIVIKCDSGRDVIWVKKKVCDMEEEMWLIREKGKTERKKWMKRACEWYREDLVDSALRLCSLYGPFQWNPFFFSSLLQKNIYLRNSTGSNGRVYIDCQKHKRGFVSVSYEFGGPIRSSTLKQNQNHNRVFIVGLINLCGWWVKVRLVVHDVIVRGSHAPIYPSPHHVHCAPTSTIIYATLSSIQH